jgi:signal transduction histidine kinase
MNKKPLNALIIEDNEDDALLMARHLRRAGFDLYYERVDTADAMKTALVKHSWDVILVDYKLPQFSGLDALELTKKMNIDIPFLLVSGIMVEETAVEAMRRGASDCIKKDNLERLVPAVERELKAAKERCERKLAQEALKKSHENLEQEVVARTADYRKAKEKEEKANKAKSEFLSNISHELRTPMHQILSYSKFGVDKIGQVDDEKILYYFSKIGTIGKNLLSLLNDLLDLSKLESGRMEYDMKMIDPLIIINETIVEFYSLIDEKGIILEKNIAGSILAINCDEIKIGQVLRNLISNAIKFTPNDKKVSILIKSSELSTNGKKLIPALMFTVSDQGIGIPNDELDSIFDKFVQSSKTKTNAGGTGLGLAICKEIIKAHSGKIWAENNPEGGATFSFMLPYGQ